MIPYTFVDTLFASIAAETGRTIIAADQDGTKPLTPYATYKITSEQVEAFRAETVHNAKTGDDAEVTREERTKATVSITIVGGETDFDAIRTFASDIIDYFRWNEVNGAVVRVLSPSVEDRTTFIDAVYEYKVGYENLKRKPGLSHFLSVYIEGDNLHAL